MRDPAWAGKDSILLSAGGLDGGRGGGGGGGHAGGGGAYVGRGGWKDVEGEVMLDSSKLALSVLGTSGPSVTKST